MPGERGWYVVQTYSSYEQHVADDISRRIVAMDMSGKIFGTAIPMETRVEIRNGKPRTVKRKLYPGYVFVDMIMEEQAWYTVRQTSGVTGFIGAGNHPRPLSPEEVKRLRLDENPDEINENVKLDIDLKPGDLIRVNIENLEDRPASVIKVNPKKGTVKFRIEGFSGEMETDYKSVEKL